MIAHNELGEFECRNLQMYSISLGGSSSVFSTSKNDDRVFTSGGLVAFFIVATDWIAADGDGVGAAGEGPLKVS